MSSANINNEQNDNANQALSDETVANFLTNNPDFFHRNPTILAEMSLPHNSGNATSLIERQVAILRERGIQTRHKLGELIEAAKENDNLLNTTQSLVIDLINAGSLNNIFTLLQSELHKKFAVESASVILISDTDTQNQYSIDATFFQDTNDAEEKISGIVNNNQSLCGSLRETEADFIFNDTQYAIGSAAIASKKIERSTGADIIVMLAVAHHNTDHYNSDTGTLFLDYLCDILTALVKRQLS
ncbi:MAG: DUF484 family protein, partial [Cellvibrionales bacterium]|nr:DUF484 family protein [Cellvibrionales bacterium]